jgi:hypothetical protein
MEIGLFNKQTKRRRIMIKKIMALVALVFAVSIAPAFAAGTSPVHADLTAGFQVQQGDLGQTINLSTQDLHLSALLAPKLDVYGDIVENEFNHAPYTNVAFGQTTWQAGVGYKLSPGLKWNISGGTLLQNYFVGPGQLRVVREVGTSLTAHLF